MTANISTPSPELVLAKALSGLPGDFSQRIAKLFITLQRRFVRASFTDEDCDSYGITLCKFCETVFRALQHILTGSHIPFGRQIPHFPDECRKLENLPQSSGQETLRVIIPRALIPAYTLRDKRGLGHIG